MIYKLNNVVKSIPDDRDYPYVPLTRLLRTDVDLMPEVEEVEDQGNIGSCTCNSSISALEMFKKESYSRLFPYYVVRNDIEGKPGQEGASLRDAIRTHYHFGVVTEDVWPYDVTQENVRPPDAVYNAALSRKVTRYENIAVSPAGTTDLRPEADVIHDVKSALNEGLPVVFACRVGQMFFGLKGPWQAQEYPPVDGPTPAGNPMAGWHAIVVIGDSDSAQRFLILNSWNKTWGDGGFGGIPYHTFYKDVAEMWVIRGFMDVMVPQPVPVPLDPKYKLDPVECLTAFQNMRPPANLTADNPSVQWCAINCSSLNDIYDMGIQYIQGLKK